MGNFTIGKLARSALVGVETVRFYERVGLIRRPEKKGTGFRRYEAEDAERIRFIKRAQELGYTLREIKELLDLGDNRRTTSADYIVRIKRKLAEIDRKIQDLERMKSALADIMASCEIGACPQECRPLDCFENGCEAPNRDQQKVKR